MKLSGTITYLSPESSGTSTNGSNWRKIEAVLTYNTSNAAHPNAVLFTVMNDRIDQMRLEVGKGYEVSLDFDVREYNGRRFLSATAWAAKPLGV